MHFSSLIAAAAIGGSVMVSAAPAATPIDKRATSCTFSGSSGAASATKSKAACATIVLNNVAVPAGTTLDLTGLTTGTHVIFEGTTTFGYKEWAGPLVSVSGTSITVTGAAGSVLDGSGQLYWDGQGSNGGKTKPKFFYAHSLTSSSINGLTIKNSPVQIFSINGAKQLTMDKITIDNSAGDAKNGVEVGHNTDAFDIGSSTGVTITGAVVHNQDDCVAVNSGTDITFSGGSCTGGHGLSIGSVGGRSDNTVSNVHFTNNKIINSQNGIRIKTVYGATGKVSGVNYTGTTLSNITKYGIVIEQDYENGSPTGTPTTGVPITELTVSGVSGSVASNAVPVYILCGNGSCSDWTWKNVNITGGKASTKCAGVPTGASC